MKLKLRIHVRPTRLHHHHLWVAHILRGGDWDENNTLSHTSAVRGWSSPDVVDDLSGFRVVLVRKGRS